MTARAVITSNSGFPSVAGPGTALTVDDATNSVTIGSAGVSNGNGVRNGSSRTVVANKPTAPVDIVGGLTATVTQVLEAGIFLCSVTATLTLPTMQGAVGLVQALPGTPAVGDVFEFMQSVTAAQTATLAAGVGATIASVATTAAGTRIFRGRVTSVAANAETVTFY